MRVKTEDIKLITFNQYVDAHALVIRDEVVIRNDSEFTRLVVDDKSKIAKNQTISLIYDSEKDLDNDFEFSLNNNKNTKYELNDLDSINIKINNLIRCFHKNGKYDQDIKELILSKEKIIDNKLNSKLKAENIIRPKFSEIKSEFNGIFSYFTDGFEKDLHLSMDLSNINFDNYKVNKEIDKNILGKIVNGRKCLILCDKQIDLKDDLYLKFGNSNNEIKCKLLRSNNNQSIFETEVDDDLIDLRLEDVKIKVESCNGFKIPKNAIHEENGIKGVFIVDRKILVFKEIDIRYETDKFVICDYDEDKPNQLQENDTVVISGRNLYDGKILMY